MTEQLRRRRSMSDFLRFQAQRDVNRTSPPNWILDAVFSRVQNDLASQRKIREFSEGLPKLTKRELVAIDEMDSSCPICLTPFSAILDEEEMALALETPAHPIEQLGVTRFKDTCGHIFCRKDALSWLNQGRATCPTCRRPFIDLPDTPEFPQLAGGAEMTLPEGGTVQFSPSEYSAEVAHFLLPGLERLRASGRDPETLIAQAREARRRELREQREREADGREHDTDDRDHFSGMYS